MLRPLKPPLLLLYLTRGGANEDRLAAADDEYNDDGCSGLESLEGVQGPLMFNYTARIFVQVFPSRNWGGDGGYMLYQIGYHWWPFDQRLTQRSSYTVIPDHSWVCNKFSNCRTLIILSCAFSHDTTKVVFDQSVNPFHLAFSPPPPTVALIKRTSFYGPVIIGRTGWIRVGLQFPTNFIW